MYDEYMNIIHTSIKYDVPYECVNATFTVLNITLHGAPFIKPAGIGKELSRGTLRKKPLILWSKCSYIFILRSVPFESYAYDRPHRSSQNSAIADSHVFINKQEKKMVAEKDRKRLQKWQAIKNDYLILKHILLIST